MRQKQGTNRPKVIINRLRDGFVNIGDFIRQRWRGRYKLWFSVNTLSILIACASVIPVLAAQVTIEATVTTTASVHDGTAPVSVFISDQVGYVFYRETTGDCNYKKTTDGGANWGTAVIAIPTNCHHIAIWYDRWTPGDNTGTVIHLLGNDPNSDDLEYNTLDTSSDTLGTSVAITSSPGPAKTNTWQSHDNYQYISKSTTGVLYAGIQDSDTSGDQSYILKCSTTCSTDSNWSDTSISLPQDPDVQAKNNPLILLPQPDGDMLAIIQDGTTADVQSKLYDAGTATWDTNWTTVDAAADYNGGRAASNMGAVVDRRNYKVYLAYLADATTLGTNDDIRTATYSGGSWTAGTDVLTNDSKGLVQAHISMNENNGTIYVGYNAQTTPATIATGNQYWKSSTDGMATWGTEQGPMNTSANDEWGNRFSPPSNERIYAIWTEAATSSTNPRPLVGDTVADLTPPTFIQSAFRMFNNANSTDVGTALAVQDTAASLSNTGAQFRVRMLLHHNGGDTARVNMEDYKLQFVGKGSGSCASPSGGTPASYTDVTTSTLISYHNNATPADGAALTNNANDPTHTGHTVRNQTYEEVNNFSNTQAAIASGEDGKWDFALYDNGAAGSTAYCLRIVKSDGTALSSYTVYPQITTASGNTAPNTAASLAQKKTDDTVLATGDWTNQTSVKFTANLSDPDSSDTLQLCVEKKALGVAFTNTEDSCGTGVAYSGTPVAASVTIASITDATEYHWQARTKDAAGAYSAWTSYDVNAESARDFGVDSTAPTGGTVYDGTSAGVDATFNDGSLSSLSANWSGINSNVSGLLRYEYSIGTAPGGTTVKGWTNNNTATSVTATSLSLQTSTVYYVNVRAVDNAGNTQSLISSDGQLILPTLSFGVSPGTVSFDNLNSGNSFTSTKTTTLTTYTNAYGGYLIRSFITGDLQSPTGTIGGFTGGSYASPDTWQAGDTGFGYTSDDTTIQGVNIFQNNPCPGGTAHATPGCYAPFSQVKPGDIVADHTANVVGSPIANENFTITYRVTTAASQAAGNGYSTTIVYTVLPIY